MNRLELLAHVRNQYGIEPDYPWMKYPDYAVLRHRDTRKWFGVVMTVPKAKLGLFGKGSVELLNVKCDPLAMGSLKSDSGILPAYHMNKEHWISILLESPLPSNLIYDLVEQSYQLTRKSI